MTTLDPTLLPALEAIESVLNRPRQLDKRALLNSMQRMDYEMRLRHYPAVMESDGPDAREFFDAQQSPSDSAFR